MSSPFNTVNGLPTTVRDKANTPDDANPNSPSGRKPNPEIRRKAALKPLKLDELTEKQRDTFDLIVKILSLKMAQTNPKEIDRLLEIDSKRRNARSTYILATNPELTQLAQSWLLVNMHQEVRMGQLAFYELVGSAAKNAVGYLNQVVVGGDETKERSDITRTTPKQMTHMNIHPIPDAQRTAAVRTKAAEVLTKLAMYVHDKHDEKHPADDKRQATNPLSEGFSEKVENASKKATELKLVKKENDDGSPEEAR